MAETLTKDDKLALVEAAQEIQTEIKTSKQALSIITNYIRADRFGWWDVGEALVVVKNKTLWEGRNPKNLDLFDADRSEYHSFEDFISRGFQKSRASAYRFMALRRELSTLTPDDARAISQSNARWLLKYKKRCSDSKWANPTWIEKAKTMGEDEFGDFINDKMPGAAREEEKITLSIDGSLEKIYRQVIKTAKKVYTLEDEVDCLEAALSYFLAGPCGHEDHDGKSNVECATGKKFKAKKETQHVASKDADVQQSLRDAQPATELQQ